MAIKKKHEKCLQMYSLEQRFFLKKIMPKSTWPDATPAVGKKPVCTRSFRFKIAANTQFITRASAALILTRAQSKRTRTTATV